MSASNGLKIARIGSIEDHYDSDEQISTTNKLNTEDNGSDLTEIMSPLIRIMRILGTWPNTGETLWQRLSPWNKFSLFIIHFYSFNILIEYLFKTNPKTTIFSHFSQMTAFFRAFVVTIIINIRFLRQQKVLKLFREISSFPTFSDRYDLKNLSKDFKNLFIGFIIFGIIQTIVTIDAMFNQTSDPFMNLIFHRIGTNSNLLIIDLIYMIFQWICYLFFILFNECSNKLYFLCICLILRNKIRDFNSYLRQLEISNTVCSVRQIQQIYRMHSVLTSMVEGIEDNFSIQSFLWVFSLTINICAKIQVIVTEIKTNDLSLLPFILADMLYLSTIFVSILLISSEIGEQNSGPVLSVTKIGENADINDLNLQQTIQLLVTKLNTPVMRLTGWNCFELNKRFMLTMLGALITFMVVVLQVS